MFLHEFQKESSIFSQYLAEIRDVQTQKDPLRFRENVRRMSTIMAYEVSKHLSYEDKSVETPLGESPSKVLAKQPVIASILRAGIPMHLGFLEMFDHAQNAFISAYRKTHKDHSFDIMVEYLASPKLDGADLIICDPMLATGRSMALCYEALMKKGTPRKVHLVALIASEEGVDYIKQQFGQGVRLWVGAIDEELNAKAYIVPGLGDAGDLAFGVKE